MLLAKKMNMLQLLPAIIGTATGAAAGALLVRERRIRRSVERLGAATLEALLDAVDANNPETGAHVRRVANYSLILATAADLDERECHAIERVALFHDIGKLDGAVSDIVDISTVLTEGERERIRTHPERGAHVLQPLEAFYPELPAGVIAHHERWDGTGYPRGLAGTEIPFSARLVSIVDTFDAITTSRAYSRPKSLETAAAVIRNARGTQFDPQLVDLFLLPPVLADIGKAMKASLSPRRVTHKRRAPRPKKRDTPDINFRWRKRVLQQPTADR
jgi:HD-GYP domain-containing protein (c-di-GMP phosphodiesterase class II)